MHRLGCQSLQAVFLSEVNGEELEHRRSNIIDVFPSVGLHHSQIVHLETMQHLLVRIEIKKGESRLRSVHGGQGRVN
jgi:hypothetical protein